MKNRTLTVQKSARSASHLDEYARIEELARKASLGDRGALLALCQNIAKDVLYRVLRLVSNRMDAEDIAQEVLIRVCESIQNLKESKAFAGWLGVIISNEVARFLANQSKRNAAVFDVDGNIETVREDKENFSPYESAVREENRKIVMGVVDRLPKRQLEAVILHYYKGMSVSEAASAMAVTVQGVSRYLMLARGRIKRELEKLGEKGVNMFGLTALPMGQLLSRVLREKVGRLPLSDGAWMEQAVGNCGEVVTGGAAGGVGAAAASKMSLLLIKPAAVAAASVITVTVATVSIWVGVGQSPVKENDFAAAQIVQEAPAGLVFIGGESGFEHLNPKGAAIDAYGDPGDLTVLSWAVTTADGGSTLADGVEDVGVDAAFSDMLSGGADGEYVLVFVVRDSSGKECRLSRSFFIQSAES